MQNKKIKILIDGVVVGEVENFSYQEITPIFVVDYDHPIYLNHEYNFNYNNINVEHANFGRVSLSELLEEKEDAEKER